MTHERLRRTEATNHKDFRLVTLTLKTCTAG